MTYKVESANCVADLQRLEEQFFPLAKIAMEQIAMVAYRHARATNLFKDGTDRRRGKGLRESIKLTGSAAYNQTLIAGTNHAVFIEEGTRAHIIEAKKAKSLRFSVAGGAVFRRRVNHPGTAPRPFMQQAADAAEAVADEIIDRTVGSLF